MAAHSVGTREEWNAAREELLVREKELTRMNDELAAKRRELPWVPIEKEYAFETEDGTKSFADLFDGRSQLVIYHFMFGPEYEAGCPVCSSIADSFNGVLAHLAARDVTMIATSRAPLEKLSAYKKRLGWDFNWASTYDSDFNYDFGRTYSPEVVAEWFKNGVPDGVTNAAKMTGAEPEVFASEGPGLSSLILQDGNVYQSYETTSRGLDAVMVYYTILDRTPIGRNEGEGFWLQRHDEY